jgi:hypothetical protein
MRSRYCHQANSREREGRSFRSLMKSPSVTSFSVASSIIRIVSSRGVRCPARMRRIVEAGTPTFSANRLGLIFFLLRYAASFMVLQYLPHGKTIIKTFCPLALDREISSIENRIDAG